MIKNTFYVYSSITVPYYAYIMYNYHDMFVSSLYAHSTSDYVAVFFTEIILAIVWPITILVQLLHYIQ